MATTDYPSGIEYRWSLFKDVPEIIDTKFEDGRGYAQDALRTATETIEKLSDLASELNEIDVNIPNFDLTPPSTDDFIGTPPVAPTIELNMPEDLTEADAMNTAIGEKLLHDIVNGGPAIPADVEEAIFDRENERALLIHQDNLDRISSEWSKRGFTLPDGMLAALITQANIDHANKRKDVSRDIAIKSFELGDQNTRFAIEKGIQFYITRVEVYKTKIQAEISRIDAIVKKYMAEVEVYKGSAEVYTSLLDSKTKVFDAQVKSAVARADLIIKDAEIDIKNFEMMNGLKIEAMKAIGSINAQIVAGALSSVSAGVHMSASNAASYSYSPVQTPSD